MKLVYYPDEQSGTVNALKAANIKKIMHLFLSSGCMTKLDIVLSSGLSMSTVSDCINRLLKMDILRSCGNEESTGGRKPCIYRINRDYGEVIGIMLDRNEILITVMHSDGEVICSQSFPVREGEHYTTLLQAIETVTALREKNRGGLNAFLCMGVSVRNASISHDGIIGSGPFYGWKNVHLKELLERRYSILTQVSHAADAAAVYQQIRGIPGRLDNFLVLLRQCPEKAGIVVDGNLLHGTRNQCGILHSPEDALQLMNMLDLQTMITDFDFVDDPRCIRPGGRYDDPAYAAAICAETAWFGKIYNMMGD